MGFKLRSGNKPSFKNMGTATMKKASLIKRLTNNILCDIVIM